MTTTTICDGKYTVENNNGTLTVYRHGELFRKKDLIGDGFVLGLVQELEACLEKIDKLETEIYCFNSNGDF